jgi:hypothetical protein
MQTGLISHGHLKAFHFHNTAANVTIFVETIAHMQWSWFINEGGTMIPKLLIGLSILMSCAWAQATTPPPPPGYGSYFDWGRGADGTGYCYQFASANGQVLNGGRPVPESNCEMVSPSHFDWGQGQNGYGYCFQFTPQQLVMWQGRPVSNQQCEMVASSYYAWGRGNDGWTYCFQFTPYGRVMNEGRAVSNSYCGAR